MRTATYLVVAASTLRLVSAHALLTAVNGANGVKTTGFGVVEGTLRTGTDEQPFQTDTSVLKDLETDPCGATLRGSSIDIAQSLAAAEKQGSGQLPSLSSNLSITMDLHQVNADGGGPFTAVVNTDATGQTWVDATITQQAPGRNALLVAAPNDAQLTVQLPAGTSCTGGTNGNACLIRLSNGGAQSFANGAGPFGGCFAVQQDGGLAGASSNPGASVGKASVVASAASAATTGQAGNSQNTGTPNNAGAAQNVGKGIFGQGGQGGRDRSQGQGQQQRQRGNRQNVQRASLSQKHVALDRRVVEEQLMKREAGMALLKRNIAGLVQRSVEARALNLTAQNLQDIKTATGTAIDIPIDFLAGHDDANAKGGNSTSGISNDGVITFQQATDLKKSVQDAIAAALAVLVNSGADITAGTGLDPADTSRSNRQARLDIDNQVTSSVNAGNAGVGFINTASVAAQVGGLAVINTSELLPGETQALSLDNATATASSTAAASTITQAAGKNAGNVTRNGAQGGEGGGQGGQRGQSQGGQRGQSGQGARKQGGNPSFGGNGRGNQNRMHKRRFS